MSNKRWWLPTQKGTELFPRTTISPPKLVIDGVPTGTIIYDEVAQLFGGQLKAFHGRAQQAYSLSTSDTMKIRKTIPGARMVYTNIEGQETLHLEVDHSVLEKLEKQEKTRWDFALVEIVVPDRQADVGGSVPTLHALAQMNFPFVEPILPDSELEFPGISVANSSIYPFGPPPDWHDRWVNSPSPQDPELVVGLDPGTTELASFLVDLRPAEGLTMVAVDLNACMQVRNEVIPNGIVGWAVGGAGDGTGISFSPYPPTEFNLATSGHPSGVTQEEWDAAAPTPEFNIPNDRWEWADVDNLTTGPDGTVYTVQWPNPVTGIDQEVLWGIFTQGGRTPPFTESNANFQAGVLPFPAYVGVTMFKGEPRFISGRYEADAQTRYYRWELAATVPNRPGHMTLQTQGLDGLEFDEFAPDLYTKFGIPPLGTVTIDRIKGGASFKPV